MAMCRVSGCTWSAISSTFLWLMGIMIPVELGMRDDGVDGIEDHRYLGEEARAMLRDEIDRHVAPDEDQIELSPFVLRP